MEINLFDKSFSCGKLFENDNFCLSLGRGGGGNDYEDVINIFFKKYNIYLVVDETVLGEELCNEIKKNPQEAHDILFLIIMKYFTDNPSTFEAWLNDQFRIQYEKGRASLRKNLKDLLDV